MLDDLKIKEIFTKVQNLYNKNLKKLGVAKISLMKKSKFTMNALVIVYLAQNYPNTRIVSKRELTNFIQRFYPEVNDVQQARHLAAQSGWYIISGTRKDIEAIQNNVPEGSYLLKSLETCYPGFKKGKRKNLLATEDFEEIKKQYGYRCATCGSKEGEKNLRWPNTITVLQKAHMNPAKPLEKGNIIPQCEKCNRSYRNNWIFDENGLVVGISNPVVVDNCSKKIKFEILKRLVKEFGFETIKTLVKEFKKS